VVEGLFFATASVALILAGTYYPIAGTLLTLLWPFLVTLVVVRRGLWVGLATVVATGTLLAALVGPLVGLMVVTGVVAFLGLVIGHGLREGWSAARIIAAGSAAGVLSFLISITLSQAVLGVDLVQQQAGLMEEAARGFAQSLGSVQEDPLRAEALTQLQDSVAAVFGLIFPSLALVSSAALSFWTYGLVSLILPRLGHSVPAFVPFARWRGPSWMLYLYLGASLLLMFQVSRTSYLYSLAVNVVFLLAIAYSILGLSLVYYLVRRWLVKPLAAVLVALMVFIPIAGQVAMLAGMADSMFDMRSLLVKGS